MFIACQSKLKSKLESMYNALKNGGLKATVWLLGREMSCLVEMLKLKCLG